jgi:hypothetical protein
VAIICRFSIQSRVNLRVGAAFCLSSAFRTKKCRTAEQLADMIVGALGINDVHIRVRKDHAHGWSPTVVRLLVTRLVIKGALTN